LSGKIVAWAAAVMRSVFMEVEMTTQQLHGIRPVIITDVLDTPRRYESARVVHIEM
jgi:hypothetical protein